MLSSSTRKASKPIVVGHRGFCSAAPENTLISFKKAIEQKVDMIECDVHKSKDGHLVILHDGTVDRTTNGTGSVEDMDLADIKKLDAGSKFSLEFAGEQIPTFEELLDLIQKSNLGMIIEIKGWKSIEKEVVDLVHSYKLSDRVIIGSFNPEVGPNVKKADPEIPVMLLTMGDHKFSTTEAESIVQSVKNAEGTILGINYECISPELVDAVHKAGFILDAWTVNTKSDIIAIQKMGVEIITSNYDDLLMDVVSRKEQ